MKIVFFGNADFGCKTLSALEASDHEILAVVTNKDKKSGRKLKLSYTPIKREAVKLGLNIIEVDDFHLSSFKEELIKLSADIFVVIAYRILPKQIYSIPKLGSINLHASLLPSYKGAAPIQRAIINGEDYPGLSVFFLNDFVDSGELISQLKVNVEESDSFGDVWNNLYLKSPNFMLKTLDLISSNKKSLISNLNLEESYAPKIKREELQIDWKEKNNLIYNKIRAFSPFPSMYTSLNGKRIKILKSNKSNYTNSKYSVSGSVLEDSGKLIVKCGEGFLEILRLQPESKKEMSSIDFINGFLKSSSKTLNVFE